MLNMLGMLHMLRMLRVLLHMLGVLHVLRMLLVLRMLFMLLVLRVLLLMLWLLLLLTPWTSRISSPIIVLSHLLEAVVGPSPIDSWNVLGGTSRLILLAASRWAVPVGTPTPPTHPKSSPPTTPMLPLTTPPTTQTAEVFVQQTIVMTPEHANHGNKRRILIETLLVGLAG